MAICTSGRPILGITDKNETCGRKVVMLRVEKSGEIVKLCPRCDGPATMLAQREEA